MAGSNRQQGAGIKRFKPGVARPVHLLCAATLWTGVGIFLVIRGIILLKSDDGLWLIGAGMLLGMIKSYVILDRTAQRVIERIRRFADNTCIGAVYSWKTWLVVLAMAVFGMAIRKTALPPLPIGTICVAVGWALVYSSRRAWLAWRQWERGA